MTFCIPGDVTGEGVDLEKPPDNTSLIISRSIPLLFTVPQWKQNLND